VIQRAANGSRKVSVPPPTTQTIIDRSKRHHTSKRYFEIFNQKFPKKFLGKPDRLAIFRNREVFP